MQKQNINLNLAHFLGTSLPVCLSVRPAVHFWNQLPISWFWTFAHFYFKGKLLISRNFISEYMAEYATFFCKFSSFFGVNAVQKTATKPTAFQFPQKWIFPVILYCVGPKALET